MRPIDRARGRLVRLATPLLLAGALALPAAAPAAAAEPDFPASNSGYHNWPELVGEIKQAAADYPSIVSVFSIGKSYQGRDIWMAKISDNVAEDEAEPEVLVDALHHAREHLSDRAGARAPGLAHHATTGTDATVTRLVDTPRDVHHLRAQPRRDALRPHRQPVPRLAQEPPARRRRAGTLYTDLNRNYEYRWGCCRGSSGKPDLDHLSRARAVLRAGDPRPARLRERPRGGRGPADPDAHHAPHQRRARSCGRTATRRPTSRPT